MELYKGKTVCVEFEKAEIKDIFANNENRKIYEIVFEDGYVGFYEEDEVMEFENE